MPCCQHPASHSSTNTSVYTEPVVGKHRPTFSLACLASTLGLSWERIYMFKADSYIYLAPGSCLHTEETNCLTEKKLNQQSLSFHVAFFISIYLL